MTPDVGGTALYRRVPELADLLNDSRLCRRVKTDGPSSPLMFRTPVLIIQLE